MKRLTKNEIETINQLVKKGKPLNFIAKSIGKSKTTTYYHFRKIKGRTLSPLNIKLNNNELIGEFIGLFAGDGCIYKTPNYNYRTYLCFNITEKRYIEDLTNNVLLKLFEKRPLIFQKGNRLDLCYYSKIIHDFIRTYLTWDKNQRKTYTVCLKNKNHSNLFKIGFLRGSIDSDGYLSHKKINFATVSPYLAKDIKQFLDDLEISYYHSIYREKRKNRVDIHHIDIRKKEREKFFEVIKPRERKNLCAGGDSNFGNRTLYYDSPR